MLNVENVSYNYGSYKAIENINFNVKKGDFLGLVGEDEAGKTTLLHIVLGLQGRYTGGISLTEMVGEEKLPLDLKKVRFVPDDIIDEEQMNAKGYLNYMCKLADDYDIELQNELCEKFSVNIEEKLLDMTYQDNKLVQLIAAICAKPQLLLLDEPFNFLSKSTYYRIMDYVKKLNEEGMTVIVAVEKFEHIRFFCKSYVYLYEGEVKAYGNVTDEDVYSKVVTIFDCKEKLSEDKMEKLITSNYGRDVYLYDGDMDNLLDILHHTKCRDWLVEEMTLEEKIHMDFKRWE